MRLLPSGADRSSGSSIATRVRRALTSTRRRQIVGAALGLWLLDLLLGLLGWRLPAAVGVPARIVAGIAAAWLAWRALRSRNPTNDPRRRATAACATI